MPRKPVIPGGSRAVSLGHLVSAQCGSLSLWGMLFFSRSKTGCRWLHRRSELLSRPTGECRSFLPLTSVEAASTLTSVHAWVLMMTRDISSPSALIRIVGVLRSSVFPRHRIAKQHTVAAERQSQMLKKTQLEGSATPQSSMPPGPRMATPRLATPREPIMTTTEGKPPPPPGGSFAQRTSYAGVSLGEREPGMWNPSNTVH